jgi:hypothetical protein
MPRTVKSCGLDASMLALSWRQCSRIALTMVTTKPDHQREHEENRKTIAQGMPAWTGEPVVIYLRAFFCTRSCGCA